MHLSPGRIKSSQGPDVSAWLQVTYPCSKVLNIVRSQTKAKSLFVHCSFITSFTFSSTIFPCSCWFSVCQCLHGVPYRPYFLGTKCPCQRLCLHFCRYLFNSSVDLLLLTFSYFFSFLGVFFGVPLDTSLVDTKAILTGIVVYSERISRTTNLVNRFILMYTQVFTLHISICIFVYPF